MVVWIAMQLLLSLQRLFGLCVSTAAALGLKRHDDHNLSDADYTPDGLLRFSDVGHTLQLFLPQIKHIGFGVCCTWFTLTKDDTSMMNIYVSKGWNSTGFVIVTASIQAVTIDIDRRSYRCCVQADRGTCSGTVLHL